MHSGRRPARRPTVRQPVVPGGVIRGAALLALAVSLVLAGCGVPARTGVTRDVDGPQRRLPGAGSERKVPNGPGDAHSDRDLVDYYLKAAAGDVAGAPKRLAAFLAPGVRPPWPPGTPITVVRQVNQPRESGLFNEYEVKMTFQPVGVIQKDDGIVEPLTGPPELVERTYTVRHGDEPGGPARFLALQPDDTSIFMVSQALRDLYVPHPIYFWDNGPREILLPDLRYLPLSLEAPARPTQIIRWMLEGPSEWLRPAVRHEDGVELRDNAVVSDGRLVVNLSTTASGLAPDLWLKQLRWSLSETYAGPVELQIERQVRGRSDDQTYRTANPAAVGGAASSFCIADGRVAAITSVDGEQERLCQLDASLPGVLTAETNRSVVAAAVARNGQRAALVRAAGQKRQLCLVEAGRGRPWVSRSMSRMDRPVWLPLGGAATRGLLPADGRLWLFTAGQDPQLEQLTTPAGLTGVTAVAVAPDGKRIALVARGQLYVAATLDLEHRSLTGVRALWTSVSDIVGVGWSQQTHLVVGGRNAVTDGPEVVEVTVDGALEYNLDEPDGLAITHVAAVPNNAAGPAAPGPVMITAGGHGFDVYVSSYTPIRPATSASPAAGARTPAVTGTPAVTAAFFAD